MTARSISMPLGSEACSTPRSTTPSFSTCRRLESIFPRCLQSWVAATRRHGPNQLRCDMLSSDNPTAMERVIIPIYFDYASTLCYIAWRIVSDLERELDFEALWKGVPISIRDFKARAGLELGSREYQKVIMVAAET